MNNKVLLIALIIGAVHAPSFAQNGYYRTKCLRTLQNWKERVTRQEVSTPEDAPVYLVKRTITTTSDTPYVCSGSLTTSNIATINKLAKDFARFEDAMLTPHQTQLQPTLTLNPDAKERFQWNVPFPADQIEKRIIDNKNCIIEKENAAASAYNAQSVASAQGRALHLRAAYAQFIDLNPGLRAALKEVNPSSLPASLFTEQLTK